MREKNVTTSLLETCYLAHDEMDASKLVSGAERVALMSEKNDWTQPVETVMNTRDR